MRTPVRAIVVAALAAATLVAVTVPAVAATPDPRRTAMDAAVQGGAPGIVVVTDEFRGSAGVAEVGRPARPDPNGRWRIGSVSKTFTATMVLQLVAKGRITLDTTVQSVLPGLLPYPEPITVHQVLQHTAGLPNGLAAEDAWETLPEIDTERYVHFDPVQLVKLETKQPLVFPPGKGWAYSNTGYDLLGVLIEKVTGKPLDRVLADQITNPLRLRDTFLPGDRPEVPNAAARSYERIYPEPAPLTDVTSYNMTRAFGSGELISSGADLNRFFSALLGGRLLPPDLLAKMKTTVPAVRPDGQPLGIDYGLGLMRYDFGQYCTNGPAQVWGHAGGVPGYSTLAFASEDGAKQAASMVSIGLTQPEAADTGQRRATAARFCTLTP